MQKLLIIPVDCIWGTFGSWNKCNATCNGGKKWRERQVKVPAENNGKPCIGKTVEMKSCNDHKCPGIKQESYLLMIFFAKYVKNLFNNKMCFKDVLSAYV